MLDLGRLLPKVRDSKNQIRLFNSNKIYLSIIKETYLPPSKAKIVMEKVVRKIIAANPKVLTAPEIREIVCSQLVECGYERERFFYTRLGIPFRDAEKIFQSNTSEWIMQQLIYESVKYQYEEIIKIQRGLNKK